MAHTSERSSLGHTLIIANPASQSGAGREFAERLQRFLLLYHSAPGALEDPITFDLEMTEYPGHAAALAETAQNFDTVLALGGDGTVHEVLNGLMAIERNQRPTLGVIPVGSGNDFARTLGIEHALDKTFAPLLTWQPSLIDVGQVTINPNTTSAAVSYYAETFSVGLDAAIGLGTIDLRKTSKLSGNALYIVSGLKHFGEKYRTFSMELRVGNEDPRALEVYTMAIQLGPTYGSGFAICPDANPTDGLFDISYAEGPASRIATLPTFLLARFGKAGVSPLIHSLQAHTVELTLPSDDYPIQSDGEPLHASKVALTCLHHEIQVLQPAP